MAKKTKVVENPFEKELAECIVIVKDGVNGRTATTIFHQKMYSSTAPTDLPKRQQKPFAIKNLMNQIRRAYGIKIID